MNFCSRSWTYVHLRLQRGGERERVQVRAKHKFESRLLSWALKHLGDMFLNVLKKCLYTAGCFSTFFRRAMSIDRKKLGKTLKHTDSEERERERCAQCPGNKNRKSLWTKSSRNTGRTKSEMVPLITPMTLNVRKSETHAPSRSALGKKQGHLPTFCLVSWPPRCLS